MKMAINNGYAVISSTIYQESGFEDYRFAACLAAQEMGFTVIRNNENPGSTQRSFERCMEEDSPVFIAIIGEDVNKNVATEYRKALENGLYIITLLKVGEDGHISEKTQNKLKSLSFYIYDKDCSTFSNCEKLYEALKKRLAEYIQNLRQKKIHVLRKRDEVYDISCQMIMQAKRRVILCQSTSTLILGPKDGTNENHLYDTIFDWIKTTKNPVQFTHIFSEKKTKEAMGRKMYSRVRSAKANLQEMMGIGKKPADDDTAVKLFLYTVDEVRPFVIVDDSMLLQIELRKGEYYYFQVPSSMLWAKDSDALVTDLQANSGEFFCSSDDKKYAAAQINAIYKKKSNA
jgi:hypothetical protein